jgi:hypothetical protein
MLPNGDFKDKLFKLFGALEIRKEEQSTTLISWVSSFFKEAPEDLRNKRIKTSEPIKNATSQDAQYNLFQKKRN